MSVRHPAANVEKSASSREEFAFISNICTDLLALTPRLVYADWLEDQGDPRAAYVRDLAHVIQSLSTESNLPSPDKYPRAWTAMLGAGLFKGIVKHGLIPVAEAVVRLARPGLWIVTTVQDEEQLPIGSSKFGGHPDLPEEVDWPCCSEGRLGFVAQFRLADFEFTQASRYLPPTGNLLLFAYQNWITGHQPGSGSPIMRDDTALQYIRDDRTLHRRAAPADLGASGNQVMRCCSLSFCESWDLPDLDDLLPAASEVHLQLLREQKLQRRMFRLRTELGGFGSHMLGYSVHFRTNDPSPGREWNPLLCLDSDTNMGWSWCDGDHLSVWIPKAGMDQGVRQEAFGYAG